MSIVFFVSQIQTEFFNLVKMDSSKEKKFKNPCGQFFSRGVADLAKSFENQGLAGFGRI